MKIKRATLLSWTEFEIEVDGSDEFPHFDFMIGDTIVFGTLMSKVKNVYSFSFYHPYELLGNYIHVKTENDDIVVDVTKMPRRSDFDFAYAYFGDDLGPTYFYDHTNFAVWAPLASKAYVKMDNNEYEMQRTDRGVYRLTIDGDIKNKLYTYVFCINGMMIETIDPYAKSGNANNEKSAVIDLEELRGESFEECLPVLESDLDAIIYEGHVRDLTIHPGTDIDKKGTFLGLIEKGKKTLGGNPAGFDYFSKIGFTHLQLQPIQDFGSVDENKPLASYNWGYDPMHYFTLEGSFSSNPNDPRSRMKEFLRLVQTFHRSGIRINVDVVYNHVYKYKDFALEKITPNYFFRYRNNKLTNNSGCGNDFASERAMARKMILDSIRFLFEFYHIDGLRFDLMGLIDVETIQNVYEMVKNIKPDAMVYGEGWAMCFYSEFGNIEFANMGNAKLLPGVGFFNDSYRNIMRGHGSRAKMDENGFLLGNHSYLEGAEFALLGSSVDTIYPRLFNSLSQSINYVECHDNAALMDVINESTDFENPLRIVKLFNKTLMLSPGIPFIHAGQEIGQSKRNQFNTYNFGDIYNQFDYKLLDERYDFSKTMSVYILMRKAIPTFKINDPRFLQESLSFINHKGILEMVFSDLYSQKFKIHVFINPYSENMIIKDAVPMELFIPNGINKQKLIISLSNTGIAPNKCSIFKE